jgi:hypothetical protein
MVETGITDIVLMVLAVYTSVTYMRLIERHKEILGT